MVHTTFGSEEMDITWQLIELVSALLSQRDCLQFGVNRGSEFRDQYQEKFKSSGFV